MDDKAKIPIGEPERPVSTGVRGKISIAPSNTTLSAMDHDIQTKGKVTTSVYQIPTLPDNIRGSWYRGKVFLDVRDSVFVQSTAYMYAASTIELVKLQDPERKSSVLFKYSDGGTEHRNILIKVQLSLIAVFKILNVDMLIAARCAPGYSWTNPVERQMSILNIALQNCALEREGSSDDIEGNS